LSEGLAAKGSDVSVVRVADGSLSSDPRVVGELINGSPASVAATAELVNLSEIAIVQHEYGIYGGADGDEVVDILGGLHIPSIVVAHTVLKDPTRRQRSVLETIAAMTDQVVVMSDAARQRLRLSFNVDRRKITTIAHGAAVLRNTPVKRSGRPTLLTWGLLGPGKGIERVIEAMGSLRQLDGRPRYLIAGRTHPKVLAADGEAYRDACAEQARLRGVADSVCFDANYHDVSSLTALVRSSAVVVLPYDSTDQVTSGVLVDAVASGRPVVATAFPHAVELLGSGAGIVVGHNDPDALASALRRVLTEPRLAGSMAAEARRLAPAMAWPVVAGAYLDLAHRIFAKRRAIGAIA
jgi:glycosyltransferase involved in cell wall biosynthesis